MINKILNKENELYLRACQIATLFIVYFLCRLFFQQITIAKIGFIFPTGVIVEMFYGAGEFIKKEWLFRIEHTQFVLGESCSGTTFFSLLIAYIAYRIKTHKTPLIWLLLAYPIAIIANAMRVLSSIYAYNISAILNVSSFRDEVHVITGSIAFLCGFLFVAYIIEKPKHRLRHEG